MGPAYRTTTTAGMNLTDIRNHEECGHIFTTYILPDIFHFVAFIIGFIHFRVNEGEPMYALMEKVHRLDCEQLDHRPFPFRSSFMRIKACVYSVPIASFVD